jgi:hypothetical protein
MGRCLRSRRISALAALYFAAPAFALTVPSGTELQIRLKTKVSTKDAKAKDAVEALLIAPVMSGAEFALPAGALLHGTVETAAAATDQRATLLLNFGEIEIGTEHLKLEARVASVDNARESVDEQGRITGILASETATSRLDAGINKIAERYAGLAGVLSAAKGVVLKPAEGDIVYEAGVEMTLRLTAALELKAAGGPGPAAKLKPIADEDALEALVAAEPFQTMAEKPSKPSDITNIILTGAEEQVRQVFTEAGWSTAAALSTESKFQTLRALAEDRGYSEAPVSILLLDGKPPDMVFQKLNNTFARRHHLRVWRRPSQYEGRPVWAVAATHDIGIAFSEQNRTFIHQIDSEIDRERAKVVNDLLLTGRVESLALVERPQVPRGAENATGDKLATDGKVAVLTLN